MTEGTNTTSSNIIDEALASDIDTVYANGYQVAAGQADVVMILQRNGKSVQAINMSFSLAKTLAEGLSGVIQEFESKTGMTIKTTNEISKAFEQ